MKRLIGLIIAGILLTGCASITAIPLKSTGEKKGAQFEEGIRYYIPKPYLLVMALPAAPQGTQPADSAAETAKDKKAADGAAVTAKDKKAADGAAVTAKDKKAADGAADGKQKQDNADDKGSQTDSSKAQASDTSFSVTNTLYTAKIIYLPDYSQPIVLQTKTGAFGTATMAPTLQDGWMLTSLNTSSDSGGAAVVSAITQMAGSIWGAAPTTKTKAPQPQAPQMPSWNKYVLPPGLYEFEYDKEKGTFMGLKPIRFFSNQGLTDKPPQVE